MGFNYLVLILLLSCAQVKKLALDSPIVPVEAFKLKWAKELDPIYSTGNFPIGTSSPFVFEDLLYMGNLRGEMIAYDLESGREVWKQKENGPIQSQVNKLGDIILYGTQTGRLIARHYFTGKMVYAVDLGAPIESQPSFIQGRVILHLRNHSLVVLDVQTGKVFWRYKRSVPYSTTLQRVSHVNTQEGAILVGFADGNVALLSLEEGVIKWEQKISTGVKFVDVDVMPVRVGKYIVAGSATGPMRLLNPLNGVIEKTVELNQSHTPLIEDSSFLVGTTDGKIVRVSHEGKILQSKTIGSDAISSIKKWRQGLIVTTVGSRLYYLDPDRFQQLGSFDLGSSQSAVFGEAVVSENGILSIYSSRNRLYTFQ